jgi:hypothetical protein
MAELFRIFMILGPSGVGKTCLTNCIVNRLGLVHVEFDRNAPFRANGLPQEWETDVELLDMSQVVSMAATAPTRVKAWRCPVVRNDSPVFAQTVG